MPDPVNVMQRMLEAFQRAGHTADALTNVHTASVPLQALWVTGKITLSQRGAARPVMGSRLRRHAGAAAAGGAEPSDPGRAAAAGLRRAVGVGVSRIPSAVRGILAAGQPQLEAHLLRRCDSTQLAGLVDICQTKFITRLPVSTEHALLCSNRPHPGNRPQVDNKDNEATLPVPTPVT